MRLEPCGPDSICVAFQGRILRDAPIDAPRDEEELSIGLAQNAPNRTAATSARAAKAATTFSFKAMSIAAPSGGLHRNGL